MRNVFAWIMFAILMPYMIVNAAFMLISPRAWFRLPGWLRAQGGLTKRRFAHGVGALQVPITKGLMLAAFGWVAYHFFTY